MGDLQGGVVTLETTVVAIVVIFLLLLGAGLRVFWRRNGKIPVVVVSKPSRIFSRSDYRTAGEDSEVLLAWGKALNSGSVESDKVIGDLVADYNASSLLRRIAFGEHPVTLLVGAFAEFFSGISLARGILSIAERAYDTIPFMRTGHVRIIIRREGPGTPDAYTVDYRITARDGSGSARRIRGVLRGDDASLLLESVAIIHMHHERRHSGLQRVSPVNTVSREGPLLAYIKVLRELREESDVSIDETSKDMLSEVFQHVAIPRIRSALDDLDRLIYLKKYAEISDQIRFAYLLVSLLAENYVNDDITAIVTADLERIERACSALFRNKAAFRELGGDGRLVVRALGFEARVQLARHYAVRNHRYASSNGKDEASDWRNRGIEYARSVASDVLIGLDANNDNYGTAELRFLRSQVFDLYVKARRMEAFCTHCREEARDLLDGIVLYNKLFEDLSADDPSTNPLFGISADQLVMRNGSVPSSLEEWVAESEAMGRNNFGYTLLLAGCVLATREALGKDGEGVPEWEGECTLTSHEYIREAVRNFDRAIHGAAKDPSAEGRNVRTYAHSNRGYARAILGDFRGALDDNGQAIKSHIENSIDNYYFEGSLERALICAMEARTGHGVDCRAESERALRHILDQNPKDLKPRRICNQAKLCVMRAISAGAIDSPSAAALLRQIQSAWPGSSGDDGSADARDQVQQRADAVRVLFTVLRAISARSSSSVA